MRILLQKAYIWQRGSFFPGDLVVENGMVSHLGDCVSPSGFDLVFDLSNQYIFPGLADVHVHFREPGFFYKETIKTGSMAAAKGGFTSVCTMPNLSPPPDSPAHLLAQQDIIDRTAQIAVHPFACITKGQKGAGEPVNFAALAPLAAGFSDDGRGVQDQALMHRAMTEIAKTGKVLAAHCEDNTLLAGGYIHDGNYAKKHGHAGISSESEWRQVQRDLELVRQTGCAYHICHISTKESVALLRQAKAGGLDVTGETAPHYLAFTEDDLQEDGRFKMNPPLRSKADRQALIAGLLDGTIDMIATDHAPHTAEEKSKGLCGSAMGVVGLETAISAVYTTLVKPGLATMEQLAMWMSVNPRKRFALEDAQIQTGSPANLTVFDPDAIWTVNPDEFLTMGRSSPFSGKELTGRVRLTLLGNQMVWQDPTLEHKCDT